jgi:hypothetical protein
MDTVCKAQGTLAHILQTGAGALFLLPGQGWALFQTTANPKFCKFAQFEYQMPRLH